MGEISLERDSLLKEAPPVSSSDGKPKPNLERRAFLSQGSVAVERSCLQRFFLVEPVALLYFLAYKGSLPLIEQFVFSVMAAKNMPPWDRYLLNTAQVSSACSSPGENSTWGSGGSSIEDVQAQSSTALTYLNLARDIPALFSTILICSYTDMGGRKIGLILPSLGGVLKCAVYLVVAYTESPAEYVIFGRVLEGLCGSQMTAQGAIYAYLADIVPRESRSFRFTVIQASLYFGTGVGNIAIGYMIDSLDYLNSFWCVAALYAAACLYTVIFLPESNTRHCLGSGFSFRSTFKHAITVFKIFQTVDNASEDAELGTEPDSLTKPATKKKKKRLNKYLLLLLVAFGADCMITIGRNDTDVLYMLGSPFCWSSLTIGYYQGAKYLLKTFMDTLGVKFLHLFMVDSTLVMLGSLCGLCANVVMGTAVNSLMLWLAVIPAIGSAVVAPIAKAAMSKRLSSDDQGSLFSCLGLVECIADLISSSLFDVIYSATVYFYSGFIFVIIVLLYIVCASCFATCRYLDGRSKVHANPT